MGQKFTLILVALFFMNQLGAQSAREVGVEVKANLNYSKQIELKWLRQSGSTRYQVFTKNNTNPANEKIRLISTTGSLKVFSSTGKLIWSNPLLEKSVELNIRDWTAGVYIFQMTDISGNIQNVKLIKH
jgi:hypothetical protein